MKNFFILILCAWTLSACATKFSDLKPIGSLYKVEANADKGFNFPFFLYVPEIQAQKLNLLIIPNNSGGSQDGYDFQLRSAKREILKWTDLAEQTSSVLLVPAFFRPNVEPPIYTHSLSRSTLEVQSGNLKRVDLQLIDMMNYARTLISNQQGKSVREKTFLFGFSASAMFVNRFTFIHPELVAAVAFGAPGGWPLAPMKEYKDQKLIYPIGIADLDTLTGSPIDLERVKTVPMFAFLGEKDTNDSVVYRDSYTAANEKLIFSMFGKTLVQRWPFAEQFYKSSGLNATFKLYEGIGHETNRQVQDDIIRFFNSTSFR